MVGGLMVNNKPFKQETLKNTYGDYGDRTESKCHKNGQFNNIIEKVKRCKEEMRKKCENVNILIFHSKESLTTV